MARADITSTMDLDSSKFKAGLGQAKKSTTSWIKSVGKTFAAGAAAFGLARLTTGFIDLAKRIEELAGLSGTSMREFQELTFAARKYGIEQEKVGDILKDVSDKVGDFLQTGGGPLADFFENIAPKVGVTAEMFRNLSGKDALELYVQSLEKANLSQNEMTFFMEAIASDATLLLPLFRDNSKELNQLSEQANKLGIIMDDKLIQQAKEASTKFDVLKLVMTVWAGRIISKVVPVINILADWFPLLSNAVASLTLKFRAFGGFLVGVIKTSVTPAITAFEALGYSLSAAAKAASGNFIAAAKAIQKAKDVASDALSKLKNIPAEISKKYKDANDEMIAVNQQLEGESKRIQNRMIENWDRLWSNNEEGLKKSEEGTKKAAGAADTLANSLAKATKEQKQLTAATADFNKSGVVTSREQKKLKKQEEALAKLLDRLRSAEKSLESQFGGISGAEEEVAQARFGDRTHAAQMLERFYSAQNAYNAAGGILPGQTIPEQTPVAFALPEDGTVPRPLEAAAQNEPKNEINEAIKEALEKLIETNSEQKELVTTINETVMKLDGALSE